MPLSDKVKKVKPTKSQNLEPFWKGPAKDGITQSLLCQFLCCRERFRIKTILGMSPPGSFSHHTEYGDMWHLCEEALADDPDVMIGDAWVGPLRNYCRKLCKKYPTQQPEIDKWYQVCKIQFPLYVDWWSTHPDVKNRTPLLQEEVFEVPYELPSGRTTILRGKWDSVDLIKNGRKIMGVYLQENKSKGNPKEQQLQEQLRFDIQTMFYLTALQERLDIDGPKNSLFGKDYGPVKGIRYNVVRRPLSGGKGSIRQHKPTKAKPQGESTTEYYGRLSTIIADEPEFYFWRWKVNVMPAELDRFKREFLNPILESLCDWWEWVTSPLGLEDPFANSVHWRHPFGVYNPLMEGRMATEVDEYLATGSTAGLAQVTSLFKELEK